MTLSKIYRDGTYLRNNPDWHAGDAPGKAAEILKLLEAHGIKPMSVAETGCGSGEILARLALKLGPEVSFSGYEVSPQAYALCLSKQNARLRFFHKDLLDDEASFDLVLAIDVLEHVPDYLGFLLRLKNKGRHKIFRIPLNLSVQSILFKSAPLLKARARYGHLHYFTRETALAALEDSGYRVLGEFLTFGPLDRHSLGWRTYWPKAFKKLCFSLHKRWVSRLLDGFTLMVLAE